MSPPALNSTHADPSSAQPRPGERPQRRDAQRNRALVLAAAGDVLSEHGTDATVEQIAAHAGVGVGTVYRHFPNKDALVDAFVESIFEQLLSSATACLDRADGRGLEQFLDVLGGSLSAHRSYAQVLAGRPTAQCGADHLRRAIARLTVQATVAGRLADWVSVGDVMTLIWALRGVIETSHHSAPSAWRRHLDIHLSALRTIHEPSTRPAITPRRLAAIARDQRL
jgi:AcrR family transcriptional regulator